jgi:hypothetical protein
MLADWRVFNQEFCCCRAAGVYNSSRRLCGAVWATGASVWQGAGTEEAAQGLQRHPMPSRPIALLDGGAEGVEIHVQN